MGFAMVVIMLLFMGLVRGQGIQPPAIDGQMAIAKSYVEIKSDPCDYDIDYGNELTR